MANGSKDHINLNSGMSMNTFYDRPGQFPIVYLKNHDIPLRATKKKLSMTQIATPEKFFFYGSTLTGLLRSNSIVGLTKSNELARENRPIMHEPPSADTVPTRSVLDVLKEISRKRINNDADMGRVEASIKKYCYRKGLELMEGSSISNSLQECKLEFSNQHYLPVAQKRLRDSPIYLQTLPEQVPKACRLSNYNNDVSSSLSSSLISFNERKYFKNTTVKDWLPKDQIKTSQRKVHRQIYNFRTKQYSKSTNATFDVRSTHKYAATKNVMNNTREENPTPILSIPVVPKEKKEIHLTLFNKNCAVEETETDDQKVENKIKQNGDNGYTNMHFVIPKQGVELSRSKHLLMKQTQKSKLSLMLTGLRGELYTATGNNAFDAGEFTIPSLEAIECNGAVQLYQESTIEYKKKLIKRTTHRSEVIPNTARTLMTHSNNIASKTSLKGGTILPILGCSMTKTNDSLKPNSSLDDEKFLTSKTNLVTVYSRPIGNQTHQTTESTEKQLHFKGFQFGLNVKSILPIEIGNEFNNDNGGSNSTSFSRENNYCPSNSTINSSKLKLTKLPSSVSTCNKPIESEFESNAFSATAPIPSVIKLSEIKPITSSPIPFHLGQNPDYEKQITSSLKPLSSDKSRSTNLKNNEKLMFQSCSNLPPAPINDAKSISNFTFTSFTPTNPVRTTSKNICNSTRTDKAHDTVIFSVSDGENKAEKAILYSNTQLVTSESANMSSAIIRPTNKFNASFGTGIIGEVDGFCNNIPVATSASTLFPDITTNETVAAPSQMSISGFCAKTPTTIDFTFHTIPVHDPADLHSKDSNLQTNHRSVKPKYSLSSSTANHEKQQNLTLSKMFNHLEDSGRKEFSFQFHQNYVECIDKKNVVDVTSASLPILCSLEQNNNRSFNFCNKSPVSKTNIVDNIRPESTTSSNASVLLTSSPHNPPASSINTPPSTALNIFALSANDRPKRRATRRLNKP